MGKYKNFNKNNKFKEDNYIPQGRIEDLNRPIEELQLSEHCSSALKKGGIKTIRDICVQRMSKMYRIQNIGKKDCLEIRDKLKKYKLDFRPEEEKPQEQKPNNQQKNQAKNDVKPQKIKFSIFSDKELAEFLNGKREKEIFNWDEPVEEKPDLFKFKRGDKWGFRNQKGEVIIQPAYDEVGHFSEGLACVEKNEKIGYIDKQGNVVIDIAFDTACSFSDGLACVTKDDKTGYIDKEGKYVFEPVYEKGTPFSGGKALIKQDGKWGVLSKDDGSIYWS